jgi:uncharacterized protein YjbI with pentapeptide repeats
LTGRTRRGKRWRTDLSGADLSGANLGGADLSGASNLTPDQIKRALVDEQTKLPWPKK